MKERSRFGLGFLGALLLVLGIGAGWWLASDHGIAPPQAKPTANIPVPVKSAAASPIPLQTPVQTTESPTVADSGAAKLAEKYPERDLPPGEDIAKFLNGEAPSAIKDDKQK